MLPVVLDTGAVSTTLPVLPRLLFIELSTKVFDLPPPTPLKGELLLDVLDTGALLSCIPTLPRLLFKELLT